MQSADENKSGMNHYSDQEPRNLYSRDVKFCATFDDLMSSN